MERPFSTENLKTFYIERLGTISTRKELETALQEEKINLELNLDELVPPERRAEILRDNPDTLEILGVSRQVQYGYDDRVKKFTATVKIPAADILKLKETPTLPSGRILSLEVISEDGENHTQFSGANLNELKQKSRQFLITKQWDGWIYSGKAPQQQYLENFDPLGDLPNLPDPVIFGNDPVTGEPLSAFPAITVESSYNGENNYYIEYFPSREEAERAQARVLEVIERAKNEQRKKEENEKLLAPTRELLQKVENNLSIIGHDYSYYGLSHTAEIDINDKLWQARRILESDTQEAMEILQEIDERITNAFEYKEQERLAREKADTAISEHYSVCPLCSQQLQNGECTNSEHDAERIDFELDEEGQESGPAILSQITTDQNKIIAQMRVSHGEGRGQYRRYLGDVYVVHGSDFEENGWRGEPFESLKFEDFGKVLTPDQAEEKKARLEAARKKQELKEARARYQEELAYAQRQVERGYWKQGKFTKGIHPKSGEEQWELTLKSGGLVLLYVVDRWSRQPAAENRTYFYSESRVIIDTHDFRLILVQLENPFPEDIPEDEPEEKLEATSSLLTAPQSLEVSIEELKKKWGAK